MSKVVEFPRLDAGDRFRDELMTARAILCGLIDSEVTDDLVEAVEDLADDLIKACDAYKSEGRL
jgi:hypothetical protein